MPIPSCTLSTQHRPGRFGWERETCGGSRSPLEGNHVRHFRCLLDATTDGGRENQRASLLDKHRIRRDRGENGNADLIGAMRASGNEETSLAPPADLPAASSLSCPAFSSACCCCIIIITDPFGSICNLQKSHTTLFSCEMRAVES